MAMTQTTSFSSEHEPSGIVGELERSMPSNAEIERASAVTVWIKGDEKSATHFPRKNCDEAHVEKAFDLERGSIDYLQDEFGNCIFPHEMREKCQSKPFMYEFVLKEKVEIEDCLDDPRFQGNCAIELVNVPNKISRQDLECWLRKGLDSETSQWQAHWKAIEKNEADIKKLEQKMERIPDMEWLNDHGKPALSAQEEASERKRIYESCEESKKNAQMNIAKLHMKISKLEKRKRICEEIRMEKLESDELKETSLWFVVFNSLTYEDLAGQVINKQDWREVQLAMGHAEEGLVAWSHMTRRSGRFGQDIPEERTHLEVNMRGIRFKRVRHGKGTYIYPGLDIYDGEWQRGEKHGKGHRFTENMEYDGIWTGGNQQGLAEVRYSSGDTVIGDMNVNMQHPPSLLNPHQFQEGVPQGDCVYKFADGSSYEGQFHDGRVTGHGVYRNDADGEVYEGQFVDGRYHGKGKLSTEKGEICEGSWHQGVLHGHAFRKTKTKEEFVGSFDDGDRHGRGVNKEKNGDRYIGFFMHDSREGRGTFCYGNVAERWDQGLQRLALRFDNVYEGQWRGGNYRRLGIHTQSATGRVWFTTTKKSDEVYPAMKGMQRRDDVHRSRKKFSDFRRAQRAHEHSKMIMHKNLKLFLQQRRLARKMLEDEAVRLQEQREDLEDELEDLLQIKQQRAKIDRRTASLASQIAASDKDDILQEEVDRLKRHLEDLPKLSTAEIFRKAELESAAAEKRLRLKSQIQAQNSQPSEKLQEMLSAGGY